MCHVRAETEMVLGSEFGTQSLGLQAPGGDWPGKGVSLQGTPEWGSGTKPVRPEVIPSSPALCTAGSFLLLVWASAEPVLQGML